MIQPLEAIVKHRLVPLVEIRDPATAADLATTFIEAGLPILEVGLRTPVAIEAIRNAAKSKGPLALAAGTVTTVDQATQAVDAGANLIISPGINTLVVEHCLKKGVPVVPGVCTPTEIETARNYGLTTLKFFPAEAYGGVKTLKALGDVYRTFRFVPTGGVNLQNLTDYLKLPTVAACGGSWLAPADLIQNRKLDTIAQNIRDSVKLVGGLA